MLRKKLLGQLTLKQQACLWSSLDGSCERQSKFDEQKIILRLMVEDDIQVAIKLWKILNHEMSC